MGSTLFPGQLVVFSKLVGFDLGGADLGLHDQATLSLPCVEDKQSIGPAVHTFGLAPEDRFRVAMNLRPAAETFQPKWSKNARAKGCTTRKDASGTEQAKCSR